jgi:uncharacterized 2Fe-2S/4Fe-4S cluster protein (DUF4445 family)
MNKIMEHNITVHKDGINKSIKVETGKNLLKLLHENEYHISSPCKGNGTCGKCKVHVEGIINKPKSKEKHLLSDKLIENSFRLACYVDIDSDLNIYINSEEKKAKIATHSIEREVKIEPLVKKVYIHLPSPHIEDQKNDIERVEKAFDKRILKNSMNIISELPDVLRKEEYKVTAVIMGKEIIAIESGDTTSKLYGISIDIGTTTIAAYLIDMLTGKKMDVFSTLNPQKIYGADVVTRIESTNSSSDTQADMTRLVVNCVNKAIRHFITKFSLSKSDIYTVVFAGNTTMLHFLINTSARNIAIAPFIPVFLDKLELKPEELGIHINKNGRIVLIPGISAYVGADIVAGIIASDIHKDDKICLLIDIGTNGEMVLAVKGKLYACSTAAGPAFEGANIRNGVGGISGAIDHVKLEGEIFYTTIDGAKPLGICGSGIIDLIAQMIKTGVVDVTGRIVDEDELFGDNVKLASYLTEINGQSAFTILEEKLTDCGTDISITQKDIRELQNAKAAIAAGIKILYEKAGVPLDKIDKVYLAGGFGSYISIESALIIGLLPKELEGKIEAIGNSAGEGAVQCLISEKLLTKAGKISKSVNYIELSACPEFMDLYVENMLFGEE